MTDLYVSARTAAYPGGQGVAGVWVSLHGESVLAADLTDPQGLVFLGNRAVGSYEIRVTPPAGMLPVMGGRQQVVLEEGDQDQAKHAEAAGQTPRTCGPMRVGSQATRKWRLVDAAAA